jgi:hypothetical protein
MSMASGKAWGCEMSNDPIFTVAEYRRRYPAPAGFLPPLPRRVWVFALGDYIFRLSNKTGRGPDFHPREARSALFGLIRWAWAR